MEGTTVNAHRVGALLMLALMLAAGCSSTGTRNGAGSSASGGNQTSTGAKRVVTGILGNPYTLSYEINTAGTGSIRGVGETEKLIHAGLVIRDGEGNLHPQLA